MAEFTSLNGFMVKDETARNIAKGRNQAVAYSDYATMIEALNAMEKDEFKTGQNIYIGTVGVPDLWVYAVEFIRHTFTYVSDESFAEMLKENTTVQVGFFKLAMLEGQKVDLTTVNEQLAEHEADITELNQNMGNCKLSSDANGAYIEYTVDGSTVKKKLGSGTATITVPLSGSVGTSQSDSSATASLSGKLVIDIDLDAKTATITTKPTVKISLTIKSGSPSASTSNNSKTATASGTVSNVG